MQIALDFILKRVSIVNYIKAGDHIVFRETFLQWQPKAYQYFMLKVKDEALSKELTQLTFIKLWDYRHTLSDELTLETQLFRIARTTLIDTLRSKAQQRKAQMYVLKESREEFVHPATEVDTEKNIINALNALPPVRKQIFVLSRLHGFSYKQIAGKLDISDRTVEKHISLALKQLRKVLSAFF